MSLVKVSTGRATVSPTFSPLAITIPARRHWFLMLFLPLWLCGWFMGETSAIHELVKGDGGAGMFLVVWLTMWTVGGAIALLTLAWTIAGKEVLAVGSGLLTHRRQIGPIGITRAYDAHQVRDLRVTPVPEPRWGRSQNPFSITDGPIAFDYGAKTIRVGAGVDEAEAKSLVETLRERGGL
jgi:hypothetical protein